MDLKEAMLARHSVRQYKEEPLTQEEIAALEAQIEECNREGKLHIQLIRDEPEAFNSKLAHYGRFRGVRNYLALVGPKGKDLDEKCGYYGEKLVLFAQTLGLNTCWVYLTYKKIPGAIEVKNGEKLVIVIAIGHGAEVGRPHKSKSADTVSDLVEPVPAWFEHGVAAALLAPTAMNQQKFHFSRSNDTVTARAGISMCAKIDLGIAKYHFELGAGKQNFHWDV